MSDIEKTISVKGAEKVVAELEKTRQTVAALKQENRELRQTSENNSTDTMAELKGMAAQYLSVGAAIGLVTRGVQEQLAEQEKIGRVYEENNQKLLQSLALSNQLKNIGAIESFVNASSNPAQARNFLGGVMQSAPNMPIEQQMAIARNLEPAAAVLTEDQASQTGRLAGAFGKLGIKNPESVAIMAQRDAGGNASDLLGDRTLRNMGNMINAGLDPAAAVALNVASLNNDMGGKWAGGLVDALLMDDKPGDTDSAKKRAFLKDGNASSRLSRLLEDQKLAAEIMGPTKALELSRTSVGTLQRLTTAYGNAEGEPAALESLARSSEGGDDVVGQRAAEARWMKRRQKRGSSLDPWADIRAMEYEAIADQAETDGWGYVATNASRRVEASVTSRAAAAAGMSPQDYATRRQFARETNPLWDSEVLKTLEETLRDQKLINEELLKELRSRSGSQPATPTRSVHGE